MGAGATRMSAVYESVFLAQVLFAQATPMHAVFYSPHCCWSAQNTCFALLWTAECVGGQGVSGAERLFRQLSPSSLFLL